MASRGQVSGDRFTTEALLQALSPERLRSIFRELEPERDVPTAKEIVPTLLQQPGLKFSSVLASLYRDELRSVCAAHHLPVGDSSREALIDTLKRAHGVIETERPKRSLEPNATRPELGSKVWVRERQWYVERTYSLGLTTVDTNDAPDTRISALDLVCLDDDNAGARLSIVWELELGARLLSESELSPRMGFDPPHRFGAYLRALSWNQVTAAGVWRIEPKKGSSGPKEILQAPMRAGIFQQNFQMVPLLRSVAMPRVNLFIADDVGLGKTIEAGLVMSELFLRHRADMALIVCPASVALQWQQEMRSRFGLAFEIYNRDFVSKKRRDLGFAVNPFKTFPRFIISYSLLRRPEVQTLLKELLHERASDHRLARQTLLVFDEAHTIAPASSSKLYAVDSQATKAARELAPLFEHRLFLSATPHNGHSNSFSTLLELLDPTRFTRGVRVDPEVRDQVMIRRLKREVREAFGGVTFPTRKLVRHEVGSIDVPEVRLSALLSEYTELVGPKKGRGRLAFINLQKRLLSSIEAFAVTLEHHRERFQREHGTDDPDDDSSAFEEESDSLAGPTEDAVLAKEMLETKGSLKSVEASDNLPRVRALLDQMAALTSRQRTLRDAKVERIVEWLGEHVCPAFVSGKKTSRKPWTDRKVIIFTEYVDTKRYLKQRLMELIDDADEGDERIVEIYGGMSDDARQAVQEAFNSPPDVSPARILLATDAAREGLNLQGYCADLFHFDLPWNPSRMEQRNGRIDRALQPEPEVRCHYFVYPDREEDRVLDLLVKKVDTIQAELGSVGEVVMESLSQVLEAGIDKQTSLRLEEAAAPSPRIEKARRELETKKKKLEAKEKDAIDEALANSKEFLAYDSDHLKQVVEKGLELSGFKDPIRKASEKQSRDAEFAEYTVSPEGPAHWQSTLDLLRRTRKEGVSIWDWRKSEPYRPVVFEPLQRLDESRVQLYLDHPLVRRVLDRFLAQGGNSNDLFRRTVLVDPKAQKSYVVLFGRLSLFGERAARLHDQVVAISARVLASKDELDLEDDEAELLREAHHHVARIHELLDERAARVDETTKTRLLERAPKDEQALAKRLRRTVETLAKDVEIRLAARAKEEGQLLAATLRAQKERIREELDARRQEPLRFSDTEREEKSQYERDIAHLEARYRDLDLEAIEEVQRLSEGYRPILERFEPVGLVYLVPR